jgi:hypothetical protein
MFQIKKVLDGKIQGDLIEFGVYKGGTTLKMAKLLVKSSEKNKVIYGLDTFKGLPKQSREDNIKKSLKHSMDFNEINKVKEMFSKHKVNDKIILMKGLFSKSISKLRDKRFCFAYVDCDLYQGTKEALEFLMPRMKGGVIFIDDYDNKNWMGVKKAVLEILPEKDIKRFKNKAYWIDKKI